MIYNRHSGYVSARKVAPVTGIVYMYSIRVVF